MILDLLAGGGLTAAGYLVGRLARPRKSKTSVTSEPEPICGCGHHLAMHERQETGGGSCRGKVQEGTEWVGARAISFKYVPCTCQQYVGPEHLPTYLPEIS